MNKKFILIILVLVSINISLAATCDPGHSAAQICAGTFGSAGSPIEIGAYTFPGSLTAVGSFSANSISSGSSIIAQNVLIQSVLNCQGKLITDNNGKVYCGTIASDSETDPIWNSQKGSYATTASLSSYATTDSLASRLDTLGLRITGEGISDGNRGWGIYSYGDIFLANGKGIQSSGPISTTSLTAGTVSTGSVSATGLSSLYGLNVYNLAVDGTFTSGSFSTNGQPLPVSGLGIGTWDLNVEGTLNVPNTNAMNNIRGNLAIGTTNPLIKLAIGDQDTGIDWIQDGMLSIKTNGQERMKIYDNGISLSARGNPSHGLYIYVLDGTDCPDASRIGYDSHNNENKALCILAY